MNQTRFTTDISAGLTDALVSAARTSLSDSLRSGIYFTPESFDVLYTRADLYDSEAAARAANAALVEFEVAGFAEAPVRSAASAAEVPSTIGPYEFTVRFYKHGFVVRMLGDETGVILTTDNMDVNAFTDAGSAIRSLLGESREDIPTGE